MKSGMFMFLWLTAGALLAGSGLIEERYTRFSAPDFLSFEELAVLSRTAEPGGQLGEKLNRLLTTPIISNQAWYDKTAPHRPAVPRLGPVLRVAMWNIERGAKLDTIRFAFTDPEAFKSQMQTPFSPDILDHGHVEHQLAVLRDVDVLILNEVDLGISRTEYRDVAAELAKALGMNYVFATEFVEVDGLELGLETLAWKDKKLEEQMLRDLVVDQERYRGLHGTAILSRYPIERVRIHRLMKCYDWFGREKQEIAELEKGRRWTAERLFLERIQREVRQGGRMAIIADLSVPDLPEGKVTVVATHLENKCPPGCRQDQLEELLFKIREVENPVVLAGDLNTTGQDAAPTSLRRELTKRLKNPKFWAGQFIYWFNPVTLPRTLLMPANYFRNHLDPTGMHVPFFASKDESGLFKTLEKFRFTDGYGFDFRGSAGRTFYDKEKTLANSNQRAEKGFRATFSLKRDFGGVMGRYKLDWILVKPYLRNPRDESQSYRFAPHFPLTMEELNSAIEDGISDHHPITVDLPFQEPVLSNGR